MKKHRFCILACVPAVATRYRGRGARRRSYRPCHWRRDPRIYVIDFNAALKTKEQQHARTPS